MPGRDFATVAVYVTDKLATGAAVACDLPLAAYAGAALGLVLLPRAEEAITLGLLPEDLAKNFYEVVNIMASVFNENPAAPHLKLYKVRGEKLPSDVRVEPGLRRASAGPQDRGRGLRVGPAVLREHRLTLLGWPC